MNLKSRNSRASVNEIGGDLRSQSRTKSIDVSANGVGSQGGSRGQVQLAVGGGGGGGGGGSGSGGGVSGSGGGSGGVGGQSGTLSAQARKRRSSINVYDQPSSLNSRLRQLETDMLRLDEDRSKLFDDTHTALAQYELRLNEIHAILKSRQDNVDRYVEDMRLLLAAKDEFERQARLLHEKHDRIHEKFMHRETVISREIKLLKNKFELLEKNRQFKSILQKSASSASHGLSVGASLDAANDDTLSAGRDAAGGESTSTSNVLDADTFGLDGASNTPKRTSNKHSTSGWRVIKQTVSKAMRRFLGLLGISNDHPTDNRHRSSSNSLTRYARHNRVGSASMITPSGIELAPSETGDDTQPTNNISPVTSTPVDPTPVTITTL